MTLTPWLLSLTVLLSAPLRKIELLGFHYLTPGQVEHILGIKEGQEYYEPLLRGGLAKLRELYRSKGFHHFEVIGQEVKTTDQGIELRIVVQEGPRAVVEKITFEGIESLDPRDWEPLVQKYPTPRPYDEAEWTDLQNALLRLYAEQGRPFAEVAYSADSVRPDTYQVHFRIQEGPKVIIAKVKVSGLRSVRKKIVLRELKFHPPAVYQESKVLESIRGIYLTGLFSAVTRELVPLNEAGDSIVLVLHCTEIKPRYLELGVGYRLPSELEIRISAGHLNLFNNNQRLEVTGNLLIHPTEAQPDQKIVRRRAEIEYAEPYFLGFPLRALAKPFYEKDLLVQQEEYGLSLELQKIFTPYFSLTWALQWKRSPIRSDSSGPISNSIIFLPLYDSRDNLFDPTHGAFLFLRLQQAGWILGGDNYFRRIFFDYSQFIPLRRRTVLAFRLRVGSQSPFGPSTSIPATERYYLGGEGSIRGYDERSIGPLDPNTPDLHSGNHLLNFNVEVRYRWNHWGAAVFVDGGGLAETWAEAKTMKIYVSTGVGIRYFTLIGPIRLDWGYKLVDRSPGDRGRFYLGLGHMF